MEIEIFVENRNFCRKSKFWSKMEILVENRNLGGKSKFWIKICVTISLEAIPNFSTDNEYFSGVPVVIDLAGQRRARRSNGVYNMVGDTCSRPCTKQNLFAEVEVLITFNRKLKYKLDFSSCTKI